MGTREEKEKLKNRRSMLAGYFFDISKLAFAGLGIGGLSPILTGDTDLMQWGAVAVGFLVMVIFAVLANRILKL